MDKKLRLRLLAVAGIMAVAAVFPLAAYATHSWGGYHWARTANPFTLNLGDNVSAAWDPYLGTTASDWSASSVLNTIVVAGRANPRNCRATTGRVEVCSSTYGNNGWLGVAQIWVTGGAHIVQGTVRMNDTYFNTPTYNTPAWRNLVMCQEVGHTLGLDHQDENFYNTPLATCMDYSADPTLNQHPNAHDYDELGIIYAHLDSTTTLSSSPAGTHANIDVSAPREWGRAIRFDGDGRPSLFERDFGGGNRVYTFVYWAGRGRP